jgi:hypothetical protein
LDKEEDHKGKWTITVIQCIRQYKQTPEKNKQHGQSLTARRRDNERICEGLPVAAAALAK